jgi:hypothetical protein
MGYAPVDVGGGAGGYAAPDSASSPLGCGPPEVGAQLGLDDESGSCDPPVPYGSAVPGSRVRCGSVNACQGGSSVAALASEIASGRTPRSGAGRSAAEGESHPEAKLSHGEPWRSGG